MRTPDYAQYSLADFLEDDFFVRAVIETGLEKHPFWSSFLQQHPEKTDLVKEASSIIRVYRQQEFFGNEAHQDEVWHRVQASIRQQQGTPRIVPMYYKVAAAVAVIMAFSAALWLMWHNDEHTITTAYGEVKAIVLPDNSVVTLNGNSSLRYRGDWLEASPREVWLKGEAYFDVKHINKDTTKITAGDRFIVHNNGVNVEVLGTTFNVKHRGDEVNVALLSGKVRVHFSEATGPSASDLIMMPGDYIKCKNKTLAERTTLHKPGAVTAWTKHEFIFTDASLAEIVKTLQDDYGYSVDIKEDEILKLKIEGEISVTTLQELFDTIETILGLTIEKNDHNISITRK